MTHNARAAPQHSACLRRRLCARRGRVVRPLGQPRQGPHGPRLDGRLCRVAARRDRGGWCSRFPARSHSRGRWHLLARNAGPILALRPVRCRRRAAVLLHGRADPRRLDRHAARIPRACRRGVVAVAPQGPQAQPPHGDRRGDRRRRPRAAHQRVRRRAGQPRRHRLGALGNGGRDRLLHHLRRRLEPPASHQRSPRPA